MAKATVIDRDKGFKKLRQQVAETRGANVKIGVTAGVGKKQKTVKGPEGTSKKTLAEIAWFNEYGTTRTTRAGKKVPHIPARSFVGSTSDEQRKHVSRMMVGLGQAIIDRKKTVRDALAIVGEYMQAKIQAKITDLKDPPNAPSTIARKGSPANPLIATGQMRQNIRYEINIPARGLSEESGG